MRTTVAVLVILACGRSLCGQEAAKRTTVPDAAAQAEATRLCKEVYGDEYTKAKTPPLKQALAKKLIAKAAESKSDPASQFVLLKLAKDVATQADDGKTAFQAVEATAEAFEVDVVEMKLAVLVKFAAAAKEPARQKPIAEVALNLMGQAVRQDNYAVADQLGKLAVEQSRKAGDKDLASLAQGRIADAAAVAKVYEDLKDARATLEKTPSDPDANLAVGKFLCFAKGEWDKGLPLLASGNDDALKALAKEDIQGANSSTEQAKLGDGWWNVAEKQEGPAKKLIQARADHWYQQALPGLSGLTKDKVGKRIAEVKAALDNAAAAAGPKEGMPSRPCRIYISCDDAFELYVNGEKVLTGDLNNVAQKDYQFSTGDIITVKCINKGGVKGFAAAILFKGGSRITTMRGWVGYKPKSDKEWFKPENIGDLYPVVPGTNHDTTKHIKQTCHVAPPDIWGQGEICYLVYKVKF